MRITFKLFAGLAEYLPDNAQNNAVVLDLEGAVTPNQLIARYGLPEREVHLVLRNGVFVDIEDRAAPLAEGDTLAIWPPVAGG